MKQSLRYYQHEAIESILNEFKNGTKKTLIILPTGTGKTTVFAELARLFYEKGSRILVIAHREELIQQAVDRIYSFTGYFPEIEKAKRKSDKTSQIIVGSIQTMKGKRIDEFPSNHFDLIIIDEAHHASSRTYVDLINHFHSAKILGVTATPDRADEKHLSSVFDSVSYQYSFTKAIKEKFVTNIKGFKVKDFEIDLSALRTSTGKDFSDDQLDEIIIKYIEPISSAICNEQIKQLKSIVFMPSVRSAKFLSEALCANGLNSQFISGQTETGIRERILKEFRSGQISHLINCAVLTEGFDEPSIQNVIICRPTKSRGLYAQMVGRGTRINENKKIDHNGYQFVYLTEFQYKTNQHSLVKPYDLFSAKGFDKRVREKAESRGSENYLNDLEESHEAIYSVKSILSRIQKTSYGVEVYDPFAICDAAGIDLSGEFDVRFEGRMLTGQITDKQKELLQKFSVEIPQEGLTKAQASVIIDTIAKNGWKIQNIINKVKDKSIYD